MRLIGAVSMLLAAVLAGCSGAGESRSQSPTTETSASDEVVPGYTGGCKEGFTLFVQNQFSPFGTKIRRSLDEGVVSAGLRGNEKLTALGWIATGEVIYPGNPPELQGKVWFYMRELKAWVPDVGVRAVATQPAPGDEDEYFDPAAAQAAPQPPECELSPR